MDELVWFGQSTKVYVRYRLQKEGNQGKLNATQPLATGQLPRQGQGQEEDQQKSSIHSDNIPDEAARRRFMLPGHQDTGVRRDEWKIARHPLGSRLHGGIRMYAYFNLPPGRGQHQVLVVVVPVHVDSGLQAIPPHPVVNIGGEHQAKGP